MLFRSVILSAARQEPKDRDEVYILIVVESFLSMVFVRKPESAFLLLAFSGSFDLRSSRKLLSRGAQDDIVLEAFRPSYEISSALERLLRQTC